MQKYREKSFSCVCDRPTNVKFLHVLNPRKYNQRILFPKIICVAVRHFPRKAKLLIHSLCLYFMLLTNYSCFYALKLKFIVILFASLNVG